MATARNAYPRIVAIVCLLLGTQAGTLEAAAGRVSAGGDRVEPRVGRAVRHGVSPRPLRDIRVGPGAASKPRPADLRPKRDAAVASRPGPSAPDMLLQFDGAATNDNLPFSGLEVIPPDANGAAGGDNYFQAINLVFRIFDTSGNTVLGPLPNASLWEGLGGICATSTATTPLVKYDTLAARWFVSQVAFDPDDGSTHQCVAISTTLDPAGTYAQYDFVIDVAGAPPHPIATSARFGIWPEAYYMTVNQFGDSGSAGFGIYAFDRAAMLAGAPASFEYVNPGESYSDTPWGIPADLEGANPPPAGSPNFSIAVGGPDLDGSPTYLLHVWKFHADFVNPGNATFEGPEDLSIDAFAALDCGNPNLGEGCVPQLGSSQLIQAHPSALMYRLAYRRFLDHEALVTNFTLDVGGNRAAIRWFELRIENGSPFVFQQGTYAPDESYRFTGSIAMDAFGNIALGYSKSDATIHPSLAVTGRLAGDPLGTMGSENAFFEGPESLPPVVGFWGSYSSMTVDAVDGCTFWFTAEYIGEAAPFFEYSRVGAFRFPTCGVGPSGTLEGTVTESGSGNPVVGAQVTAGPVETLTDGSGHYRFLTIPVGTYDVTVSKFGLVPGSASGVVVTDGNTTTQNFVLDLAPQTLLNGVVHDGSGADWPLYARLQISAQGYAGATLFTDPVTGYYGVTLVTGVSYTIAVNAVTPGYGQVLATVPLGAAAASAPGGIVQSFSLTIDPTSCNAPGYAVLSDGLSEHFDSGVLPPGWTIVNNGFGTPWTIHAGPDCGFFSGNNTGGSGPFALVDSGCDGEVGDDSELITPSVDLSGDASAQVRFAQDFPGAGEIADVDVSTDGGLGWTNVFHQTSPAHGPNTQAVDITAVAAGQPDVRARFHYFNAFNSAWWQVDDIVLGRAGCSPLPGGLVVGNVFDANTGAGLNGATVANLPQPGAPAATTFATPDDPAQPDGLYILFSESGSQSLRASFDPYSALTRSAVIVPNSTQRLDFHLTAGRLVAAPRPLSARVNPGDIVGMTLDLTNTGTTDATFEIDELNVTPLSPSQVRGPLVDPALRASLAARTPTTASRDAASAKNLPALPGLRPARQLAGGNVLNAYSTNLGHAWGVAFNTDAGDFWLSNNVNLGGDDRDYLFLTDGTQTGDTIDDSAWVAEFAADGAYNPRTGMLWRVNVGGDDCVYELDPVAKAATGNRICPDFGTSQRGLAYDPASDTYYAGSWNDGVIHHFDASGTILDSAYVAVAVSGLAFNSSNGRLYAMTNHDLLQGFDVYVFDTRDHYNVIGAFFITAGGTPIMASMGGAGMEIDCNGHLWLVDQVAQNIYEVETDETDVCAFKEIPWLSEDPTTGAVAASAALPIACTFDSTGLLPGLRQAQLMFATDTPYAVTPVPVDFTVRFLDVSDTSIFQSFIYGAAGAGVMPGCDAAAFLFCPGAQVTRADMAGFILRAVHGAAFVPTPYAGAFNDVHAGDYNANYIQSFFEEGYTVGCGGGNFCPSAVHTRGQTAVFILKGTHGTSYVPPSCSSTHAFDDVPCPPTPEAPFGDWIGQLFTEGITAGCGGNEFCPGAGIPNEQMAAFLVRAFDIPHL